MTIVLGAVCKVRSEGWFLKVGQTWDHRPLKQPLTLNLLSATDALKEIVSLVFGWKKEAHF